jgi:hypothetical protein
MNSTRSVTLGIASLIILAFLVSCSNNSDSEIIGNRNQTELMVVHASPDTPDIRVLIDNEELVSDLPFRNATQYIAIKAGRHDVKIARAGVVNGLLYEGSMVFDAGYESLIATNLADSLQVITTTDQLASPSGVKVKIRYANLSPNAGPTNFVLTTSDNDSLSFNGIPFGDVTQFHEIAGSIQNELFIKTAASDSILVSRVAGSDKLQNGALYTVYLTGLRGSDTGPEQLAMTIVENR